MNKPKHVHKYLICLTDKAETDLEYITDYMQVSRSEAIRQGLGLMVTHVLETAEKRTKGLAALGKKGK